LRRTASNDEAEGWWRYELEHVHVDSLMAIGDWASLPSAIATAVTFVEVMPFLEPVCLRAEGAMEVAAGDRDRGIRRLRSAIARFERLSVPFEVARTRELLAGAGTDDAATLLEQALATYQDLGARPHAERARAALARTD
jgi:hypothetical protein